MCSQLWVNCRAGTGNASDRMKGSAAFSHSSHPLQEELRYVLTAMRVEVQEWRCQDKQEEINAHLFYKPLSGIICANSLLAKARHMTKLSVKG